MQTRCNNQLIMKQRGVVLVVSLLLLLVITIVGVTGMQTTILQETMAGAVRDKHIAFNAAEAALREGEGYLDGTVIGAFDDTNGRYSSDGTSEELWKSIDWGDSSKVSIYPNAGLIGSSGITLPRYIIEELPESDAPEPSIVIGFEPPAKYTLYQITARGEGKVGGIAFLQSTFLR